MKILIICALLAYCSTVINAYPSAPGTVSNVYFCYQMREETNKVI